MQHQNRQQCYESLADAESVDPKQPASHAIRTARPKRRNSVVRRSRSIFCRVSEEEYSCIAEHAGSLPVNTYARYVLLRESVLLEEILALRMIVLNLHGKEPEAVDEVKALADKYKTQLARERMQR